MPDPRTGIPTLADNFAEANKSGEEASKNTAALAKLFLEPGVDEQMKEKLANFMQGKSKENLQTAVDTANDINKGRGPYGTKASVKVGGDGSADVSEGSPGITQVYGQQAKEAKTVMDHVGKSLKPFQDQADAAKSTLDNLDLGTPQAYKLALISEARLAAGQGGSRALKSIMDAMTGQKTANMQFGDALNYVNNTSDLTVPPAAVQQLRDAVLNRMSQIQPNYQQTKQQLTKAIPQLAPLSSQTDNGKGLIDNSFGPLDSTFGELNKRNQGYVQSKTQAGQPGGLPPQAPYKPIQSNVDKLLGFFKMGGQPQQTQQQPSTQQPQQPQAPSQMVPGMQQAPTPQAGKMRVKEKASGKTGTIDSHEFDPNLYEEAQ